MRVVITLWLVTIAHVGLGANILINKILQSDKNGKEINSSSIVTNKGINQFESLPTDQEKNYRCDFENGLCSFLTNSNVNKENWKPGRGKLNAADTGPSVDHTFGNASGSYIFVNVSAAETYEVSLETTVPLKDRYCVRFFYHMYGADVGDLTVTVRTGSNTMNYFRRSKTQGDRWKEALFSVIVTQAMKNQGYKVVFTARHRSRSQVRGDIALDDIELTQGKCPDTKNEAATLCTFDDYNCGYTPSNLKGTEWQWKAQSQYSSDFKAHPKSDHTLGTLYGGYWINGIDSTSFGFSAPVTSSTLISPVYAKPKTPLNCLHFYFWLDGDGTHWMWGEVEEAYVQAHLVFPDNKRGSQWLVTKGKNVTQHREWMYVEASANITERFQLQFTSMLQSRVQAAIALDDIKLFSGNCPEAGSCDFEDDKCSWTGGEDQYDWIRKKGNSKTNDEIGPENDKTKDSPDGSYVVFSTRGKDAGAQASLQSEFLPPGGDALCLSFFYQMSGADLGSLKVLRRESNITESSLWYLNDDQGAIWQKGMVELQGSITHTQVVFRGTIGKGKNGFMALDDIRIRKGEKCDLAPAAADPRNDPCTSKPCQNEGICTRDGESFQCECVKPFSGETCDIEIEITTIVDKISTTVNQPSTVKLSTETTKWIKRSTENIVTSTSTPDCDCGEKSHRCVMHSDGNKTCFCQYGYAQINGFCSDCYCGENSESCYFDWKSNKVCICSDGYAQRKRTCEGTCLRSRECLNGGVCRRDEGGDKFCRCRPNFRGDRCEISELCESLKPSCEAIGARCEVIGRKAKCECPSGKTFRPEFGRCEGYSSLWIASLVLLTLSASLFFISTTLYCCSLRRKKEKM